MKNEKRILIFVVTLLLIFSIAIINYIVIEIRCSDEIAMIEVGMTESEVLEHLGEPSATSRWSGSYGKGIMYIYQHPYLWDYIIWLTKLRFTNKGELSLGFSRTIRVTMDEKNKVIDIGVHVPYTGRTRIIK